MIIPRNCNKKYSHCKIINLGQKSVVIKKDVKIFKLLTYCVEKVTIICYMLLKES